MALKYLTPEELEKWKASNPGKSYLDPSGNQVNVPSTTKDLGFLGNLARTVSKPFRMGGGVAQEFGYTLADLINMAQGKGQIERPKSYAGLTQEESQSLYNDPLKEGLKSAAGVMSYAVPVGAAKGVTGLKAVGQAAKSGILPGAMGGLSLSESGKELGGALTGGLTGGLFAGALQGVGEVARGVKNIKSKGLGTDIRGKAIGLDPNKLASKKGVNVKSATRGKQVIDDFFGSMDELGLPTHTSEIASSSSDQALAIYSKNFDDILARADDAVGLNGQNTKQIIENINKSFKNNPSVLKSPVYQELTGDLLGLGNAYKPSQLNAIREKAREMINFTSAQRGMGNSQRAASEFLM